MDRFIVIDKNNEQDTIDNDMSLEELCDHVACITGTKPYSLKECITLLKSKGMAVFQVD